MRFLKLVSKWFLAVFASFQLFLPAVSLNPQADEMRQLNKSQFLRMFLYERTDVDDWLSGRKYRFAKYDSEVGWLHNSRRARAASGLYVTYTYNDFDARKTIMHADLPCRINTYGSSFAMGEEVNDGQTWQEMLAAQLYEPVRNFGVGGYSTYIEYLRMKKVEARLPGRYIVFNVGSGDHCMNFVPWFRLRFRTDTDKAFHTTIPYVKLIPQQSPKASDPAAWTLIECENPCPTTESLYNLCDLDWVYNEFKDDYLLNLLMKSEDVQRKAREAIARGSIDKPVDKNDEFMWALVNIWEHPDYTRRSLLASMKVLEKVQEYAEENDKVVLYMFSYGPIEIERWLSEGKRFDTDLIEFVREKGWPHVDLLEAHGKDYKDFDISVEDYLERYFSGHNYNPQGHLFQASAIAEPLVKMMDPKPVSYVSP